jgi:hypothetical protein
VANPLREIAAAFSVHVDHKPLTDFDRRIERTKAKLRDFTTLAATTFVAGAYGAYKLVESASHADEVLNQLRVSFGKNADEVISWSRIVGKEMGRSEYTMQEALGNFGSYFATVFKGTGRDIVKMSKQMAVLATDVSSFKDVSDEEAMVRLMSGLAGETEAVRRIGVDISEATLREKGKALGINKTYTDMTNEEKTFLRFTKIVEDLQTVVAGDAVRTYKEWANSVRRTTDRFKTLSVTLGRRLMPTATKILGIVEKSADAFEEMTFRTMTWETAAVMAFGAAARAVFVFRAALIKSAKALFAAYAPWIALGVAIEDVLVFMAEGDSVIGDFITALTGMNRPLKTLEQLWNRFAHSVDNSMSKIDNAWLKILQLREAVDHPLDAKTAAEVRQDIKDKGDPLGEREARARRLDEIEELRSRIESRVRDQPMTEQDKEALRDKNSYQDAAAGDFGAFEKRYEDDDRFNLKQRKNIYLMQRAKALLAGDAIPDARDVSAGLIRPDALTLDALGPGTAFAMTPAGLGFTDTKTAAEAAAMQIQIQNVNVDARGAKDPAETESAVQRGVSGGVTKAQDEAVRRHVAAKVGGGQKARP